MGDGFANSPGRTLVTSGVSCHSRRGETVEVTRLVVESLIAAVGLLLTYLAYRHQGIRVASDRIRSYRKLWEVMRAASLTRMSGEGLGPLTPEEAKNLSSALTEWYYKDGNGMWLTAPTMRLYLTARDDLSRYAASPETDLESADLCVQELALLRREMRRDVGVLGIATELSQQDVAILKRAGVKPDHPHRRRFGFR